MADGDVRLAIRDFFQKPEITGIQKVFLDVPWFMDGAQWDIQSNEGWAAVASVHLTTSTETRLTMPWRTGSKHVDHTVGLILQYQYLIPSNFGPDESEDEWVIGLDKIIDAVKNRIRSDYTFNNPAVIFQGGQDAQDIRVTRDVPVVDIGKVVAWVVVEFNVTEIIQA